MCPQANTNSAMAQVGHPHDKGAPPWPSVPCDLECLSGKSQQRTRLQRFQSRLSGNRDTNRSSVSDCPSRNMTVAHMLAEIPEQAERQLGHQDVQPGQRAGGGRHSGADTGGIPSQRLCPDWTQGQKQVCLAQCHMRSLTCKSCGFTFGSGCTLRSERLLTASFQCQDRFECW